MEITLESPEKDDKEDFVTTVHIGEDSVEVVLQPNSTVKEVYKKLWQRGALKRLTGKHYFTKKNNTGVRQCIAVQNTFYSIVCVVTAC